jgi:RNA polymerase sigma factor (sigma-70 family)
MPDLNQWACEYLTEMLTRARNGDAEAKNILVESFTRVLRKTARKALDPRLKALVDSTDFTQDVWKSWFAHLQDETEFDNADQFLAYLETVIRHKVGMFNRTHLRTQKYDRTRELPDGALELEVLALNRQASPEEEAMAREIRQRLCAQEGAWDVIGMLESGMTREDIAREKGVNVRTVYRLLQSIRDSLRRQLGHGCG